MRIIFFTLVFYFLAMVPLSAQSVISGDDRSDRAPQSLQLPQTIESDQIDQFLAPLTDQQARGLLRQSLERQANSSTKREQGTQSMTGFVSFLDRLRQGSQAFTNNFDQIMIALPTVGGVASHALDLLTDLQRWPRLGLGVINLLVMVFAAYVAAYLVHRLFEGLESNFSELKADTGRQRSMACCFEPGSN